MFANTKTRRSKAKVRPPAEALADISLTNDRLVPTTEAAQMLGLAPKTLRNARSLREGPTPLKIGNGPRARVVYRLSDLEKYARANLQTWAPSPVAVRREQS